MTESTRILIVDDERGMCEFLQYALSGEGYDIDHANSSDEALDRMAQAPFDIVITDIRMPGMDGLDMLRRIKESAPDVIVVVMTAYPSPEYELKAVNYGAYQYLEKPIENPDVVLDIVRSLGEQR